MARKGQAQKEWWSSPEGLAQREKLRRERAGKRPPGWAEGMRRAADAELTPYELEQLADEEAAETAEEEGR